jgi:hypothetical protein
VKVPDVESRGVLPSTAPPQRAGISAVARRAIADLDRLVWPCRDCSFAMPKRASRALPTGRLVFVPSARAGRGLPRARSTPKPAIRATPRMSEESTIHDLVEHARRAMMLSIHRNLDAPMSL